MKTLNDIRNELKLGPPVTTRTKIELTWSKNPETACVIPAGTELQVHFSEVNPSSMYFEYAGALRSAKLVLASKKYTGFAKPPGMKTLERYNYDGVAKTPTGHRVEPDGFGPDGSASWLLIMGLI
jgi:hypothetical protein